MKEKGLKDVVLKAAWSWVRESFTWKYEGKGFRKVVLEAGWSLIGDPLCKITKLAFNINTG